jgi:hypothetical protein
MDCRSAEGGVSADEKVLGEATRVSEEELKMGDS